MKINFLRVLICSAGLITLSLGFPSNSFCIQSSVDCEGTISAWISSGYYGPGDCSCSSSASMPSCNTSVSGVAGPGKKHNYENDIKMMVVGTVFQSLLTSLFMDNTASQKDAEIARQKAQALAMQQALQLQKEKAAIAQAEYDKMMKMYKQLDGSGNIAFKTLSDSSLKFKGLENDPETLAANARKPFDTAPDDADPDSVPVDTGGGTAFFGDTMPIEQVEFLVQPENDPSVVDLRNAVEYVAKNIKDEIQKPVENKENEKQQKVLTPECRNLPQKLKGYIEQRAKFQKTIDTAQEQLTTWQTANRNALLNAAKEGLEVYAGDLLEGFTKRAQAAERLKRIFEKKAGQMAKDGIDVTEIRGKIERLNKMSIAGKTVETAGTIKDWQGFIKDGASGLVAQLTASNQEIEGMLEDPMMQKYFETESPELKTLLDISKIAATGKVFGKWVAKKMPIVAGIELAINQIYNGTDWYLSYKRLAEAHKINGQVMKTAMYIQKNIDDAYLALEECQ